MRCWLALFLAFALTPAHAADDGARDAARATITRQAEALVRDDATTAYAQAAPSIQGMFPTADVFLGMVRNSYRPVYRHRSFVFGKLLDLGDGALSQDVAIQDEDGIDWTAVYSLERGADGQWRISGCRLMKAEGTNA
ncbi:hypothetical protein AFCDBAGC_3264 [Methylobacterium cerastii]|uniref:DUF4864 domain-containing protein n=1 Tax=Methylobacterium cerastii TaxID=932741 RepID=A0ABQ4QJQ6_9HYPH|nr:MULTISPECIES: DUF4864 domain-containing protein [Methylobacterium]TXN13984.1 DUF4864 domain-containing protein [Methylobacterium sp. WL122]TXM69537.1 DUF4864 domain-containing protein [Methylobacterium sp. WL120]TXM71977.1 DUF4864 domain-containing protein [Methylobacterium sp. WL12]TXN03179.1 DUF4864 domain-containing protein [Methylobacterium sp. WL103]TXN84589.1 DUF4864 domain-containing protein [Methylobacterium sp. WL8]